MRILFVSSSPVNRQTSIGNSFLNLFDGFDAEFYSLYSRTGYPDKKINSAFRIADAQLVKKIFNRKKMGKKVENYEETTLEDKSAQKLETTVKLNQSQLKYIARDAVWKLAPWKNENLRAYIEEVNPDLIFSVLSSNSAVNDMAAYAAKISGAKVILYAWDDNYSYPYSKSPLLRAAQFFRRKKMRKTAALASDLFVISDIQKYDYEKIFSRECKVITKGADFSKREEKPVLHNNPLKILYAGNLALGRSETISHITKALEKINRDGKKAELRIYSATPLTDEQKKAMADSSNSFFMGSVSALEVQKLQSEADILIHAESFKEEYFNLIHYSFSTKLVDCFHSAKCIFAVGPEKAASIDCLIKNDAAVVAKSDDEIYEKLNRLINDKNMIDEYAAKAWEYGKKSFDRVNIQRLLKESIEKVLQKRN